MGGICIYVCACVYIYLGRERERERNIYVRVYVCNLVYNDCLFVLPSSLEIFIELENDVTGTNCTDIQVHII